VLEDNSVPYHITVKIWIAEKFSQCREKSKVDLNSIPTLPEA